MTIESSPIRVVLTPDERESVRAILDQHAPAHAAFVFGSRVVTSM